MRREKDNRKKTPGTTWGSGRNGPSHPRATAVTAHPILGWAQEMAFFAVKGASGSCGELQRIPADALSFVRSSTWISRSMT